MSRTAHPMIWLPVALGMFAVAWGGNTFTPLLVFYRQRGDFSALFVDSMLAMYALGVVVALLLSGPLSDRYGRKPVMLPAPVVAIVASVLIALGEHVELLMAGGRFLAGAAVGMVMTAGGSWLKELSSGASGAKRAAMSLTAGFALGALVSGVLAQWAPWPGQLAYGIHLVLTVALLPLLSVVPETRQSAHLRVKGSWWADCSVPSARLPRFMFVVVPAAPWVFGSGFTGNAIVPTLMQDRVSVPIAFNAFACLVTLGVGFVVQQFGPRICAGGGIRGTLIALGLACVGMVLAAWTAAERSLPLAIVTCAVVGACYGLGMFNGLNQVQQMAPPNDLAGLTGIFYCFTYVGMVFPAVLTRLGGVLSYPQMLGFGACVAVVTAVFVSVVSRHD